MTEVEPTRYPFVVHVRGVDQFRALESRREIPLSHVVGADVDPDVVVGWKHLRVPGTHVPGASRRAASTRRANVCSGKRTTRRRR